MQENNDILKQMKANKISIFLGAAKEMFGRLSFYIQIAILCFTGVNFWDSEFMRNVRISWAWLDFWNFMIIIVVAGVIAVILEYVFIMPGSYAFATKQFNKHGNEMMVYLKKIETKQIDMERKQKEDSDILNKIAEKVLDENSTSK